MAKSTAEDAERTKQRIMDKALEITLEQGFECATLGNIAKELGLSRSAITGHFKHKVDIASAIEPYLSKIIHDIIDFSDCYSFSSTWIEALHTSSEFRASIAALGPVVPVSEGVEGLIELINKGSEPEKRDAVYRCIGYSLHYMDKQLRQINDKSYT